MPVDTTRARIVAINATITGVVTSEKYARKFANADLPATVVFINEAQQTLQASTVGRELRNYNIALLVKTWASGEEGEAEELCEPFFERFRNAYMTRPGLWLTTNTDALANVQEAHLTADSGVIDVELGGLRYSGVRFTITVEELYTQQRGW